MNSVLFQTIIIILLVLIACGVTGIWLQNRSDNGPDPHTIGDNYKSWEE